MIKCKCFIRKNTPELREKLKESGVNVCPCVEFEDWTWLSYSEYGCHGIAKYDEFGGNHQNQFLYENKDRIDCGENEELFLALVGMKDNTDKNQYFVTQADQAWVNQEIYAPKGSIFKCLVEDRYMGENPDVTNSIVPARRATVDEIINHLTQNDSSRSI